eukprot:427538_1
MDRRKQKAKQLIHNKQFREAKQLIRHMIEDGDHNYKLYAKLADVCLQLKEFNQALKYYQESVNKNKENSSVYMKIGNLLEEHFQEHDKAKQMYEKCIQLDPENELCLFNYGKLAFKQKDFLKSEQCYSNCKTPLACVNYHYALLLLSQSSKTENKQKALALLLQATKLQPQVIKYHHQYALCAKDIGFYDEAKEAFNQAAQLSSHKDAIVLYDYAMFLSHCIKDHQTALKYLKMSLNVTDHKQYP